MCRPLAAAALLLAACNLGSHADDLEDARAKVQTAVRVAEVVNRALDLAGILPRYECGAPERGYLDDVASHLRGTAGCATVSDEEQGDGHHLLAVFPESGCAGLRGHTLRGKLKVRAQRTSEGFAVELDLHEVSVDGEMLPENVLLQKEQLAHMRGMLATLSPRRQEVLTLKFFGELQNWEIAKVLGLDERTVASHLCRGLEDLHRKYSEELARPGESAV